MDKQKTVPWKDYLTKPWVWILAALLLFAVIYGIASGTGKRETVAGSTTTAPADTASATSASTGSITAASSAVDNSLDVRQDENGDWYAYRGNQKVTDYTGLAKNAAGIWYIENGKVNFGKNGTYTDNGTTYTLEDGHVVSIDTNGSQNGSSSGGGSSGSSAQGGSSQGNSGGSGSGGSGAIDVGGMSEELVLVHDETTGEELGYISVMHAPFTVIDDETLAYWYYNLVEPSQYLWCVIVYSDKSDSTGVFAMVNNIEKDIVLRKAADGAWRIADDTKGHFYIPTDSKDSLYLLS